MNQQANNTQQEPKMSLKDFLMGENAMAQLRNYLNKDEAQIKKFVNSVVMTVVTANPKTNLQKCSNESIFNACIDAINLGLMIDNRNHAYLIAYWNDDMKQYHARLQIGYKGFVYKLKESRPDVDFKVELVFEGDEFADIESIDGIDSYKHIKNNPFKNDPAKLEGAYCYMSYFMNGEKKAKLTTMGREEIDKIKALAKSDVFWKNWYNEKAKVAVIRRALKLEFATLVADLDQYDNEHYVADSAEQTSKPQNDTLRQLSNQMEEQEEIKVDTTPKAKPEPTATEPKGASKAQPTGLF